MSLLWLLLVVLILFLDIWCAVRTWKRGHKLLFAVGILFHPFWWLGAFIPERQRALEPA
jgi:hypothetical protein